MGKKNFVSGKFLMITLSDGSFTYGRLRDAPLASFYDFRTTEPNRNLDEIASKQTLFTVGVHKSIFKRWDVIGVMPLEERLKQPVIRFWQEIGNFENCIIFDHAGNERSAAPEECEGLERWVVWSPEGVEERLLDTFLGRPNPRVQHMKVRYTDP